MRPYRGKTKDGKEVKGSLVVHNAFDLNDTIHKPEPLRTFIEERDKTWMPNDKCWRHLRFEVIPETVGESTGRTDKNGKEIYEGDIIKITDPRMIERSVVVEIVWFNCSWQVKDGGMLCIFNMDGVEVIGTIHDKEQDQ